MTTVVAALNRIARDVSVEAPSDWTAATDDEHLEIRDDFLLETVDDIADRVDWPAPVGAVYSLTGDTNETYALPSQFKRMKRDRWACYESTFRTRPVVQLHLASEYTRIQTEGLAGSTRYFKITGYPGSYSISFEEAPTSSDTFQIHYVTDYWCASSGGTSQSSFSAVGDVLMFPRRLVETGTVYRWRERKGLPFADKQMEYEALLERAGNDIKGRREIQFSGPTTVKPWESPLPDFIPSS